jgi:uncharacterized protein GlcG (DUF336 family)
MFWYVQSILGGIYSFGWAAILLSEPMEKSGINTGESQMRTRSKYYLTAFFSGLACTLLGGGAVHAQTLSCPVTNSTLRAILAQDDAANTGGFVNHFWGVVVNRQGVVCAVAYSGPTVDAQWLSSRQIAAAKAYTANGLSLNIGTGTGALSTAQLYQFVVPADSTSANPLYGLAGGNVLNSAAAYAGSYANYGTASDPMVGSVVGGTITFGGGLALYAGNTAIGGIGISGDTACADHSNAWRARILLGMQPPNPADQLPFSSTGSQQPNGHPHCPNDGPTIGAR